MEDIKMQIINDWLKAFPELSKYAPNKLCKIVGPVVFGIEMITYKSYFDGICYRPHAFCSPLWLENEKKCMHEWSSILELRNKKDLQYIIPYSQHNIFFEDAVSCMREQISIPFEGNVELSSVIKMIDLQFTMSGAAFVYWMKMQAYNFKFYAALYVENYNLLDEVIGEICKTEKDGWSDVFIKEAFGSFEQWICNLQNDANNRDLFIARVDKNKSEKKLKKLHHSELLL